MNENTVGRRTALAEQSARKQSEKMFETARMEDLAVLDKRHLAEMFALFLSVAMLVHGSRCYRLNGLPAVVLNRG